MVLQEEIPDCLQNVDKRLEITKALINILKSQTLDQVKPADVCMACGISRSTFYRYFSSVDQIPKWYRDYGAEIGMNQIGRSFTCIQGHTISISLLAQGTTLFRENVRSPRSLNAGFNYAAANSHVKAMESVLAEHGISVDQKIRYTLEALAYGACIVVSNWIKNGMDLSVEQVVDVELGLYPRFLRDAFDKPSQPTSASALIGDLMRILT
ncbi:MAG: hypothetical protein IKE43_11690 [Coriobacteriales bacterium]|nr:hypothetical protein [Coriobacteriales bacterium]